VITGRQRYPRFLGWKVARSLGWVHDGDGGRVIGMTTTASRVASRPIRINPSSWSAALQFDQAQLRPAPAELLTVAGQGPVDESGRLLHEGDICAQLSLTMRNIETVLAAARMNWADVLRLTVYTTDVDGILAAYNASSSAWVRPLHPQLCWASAGWPSPEWRWRSR
jgi:enamine deaminase RidA (YjgF/YER057c/UK114 family)